MLLHPLHITVITLIQPDEQALFGNTEVKLANANRVETEFFSPLGDFGGNIGG